MDIDKLIAIVPAIAQVLAGVAAFLAPLIVWKNGHVSRAERLRKEFNAVRECVRGMQDITIDTPEGRFAKEKAYWALAGTESVTPAAVEYVLALPMPALSLRDYVSAQDYLVHRPAALGPQLEFDWLSVYRPFRFWYPRVVLGVAFVLYIFPILPLIFFPHDVSEIYRALWPYVLFLEGTAWILFRSALPVLRANKLMERQAKFFAEQPTTT
ncbi:MAG: hypothetical protein QM639_14580 [Rhodocyclaceae bacterium]